MKVISRLDLRTDKSAKRIIYNRLITDDGEYEIIWPLTDENLEKLYKYMDEIHQGNPFGYIKSVELAGRGFF